MQDKNKAMSYVLITAARNEEAYIEGTINSVTAQTILPRKWVIISDGSEDGTDDIVKRYAAQYDFVELLRLEANGARDFASQVYGQHAGVEHLQDIEYDFIGMLDADISFQQDYYQKILQRFAANRKLGLAGGTILDKQENGFRKQLASVNSVAGGIQMFRRQCYEDIGGYIPLERGGQDTVAEVMARMHGWEVRSFCDIEVLHHRRTGTEGQSIYRAKFFIGVQEYLLGYHPMFQMAKWLYRVCEKPYLIGSVLSIAGYTWTLLRRCPRDVPNDVVKYMRREQMQRLWRTFLRKGTKQDIKAARVCIVAKYHYPVYSRLRQQAQVLEEAGIQVDILCLREKSQPKIEQLGLVTVYRITGAKAKDTVVKYLWFTLHFAMAAFLKVQLLSLRKAYDVLVVHTMPEFQVFVGIVHKFLGRPVVLDAVDLSLEVFESKWGRSRMSFLKPAVKCTQKASCAFADRIITASPGFEKRLIERGIRPEKITVVINSADARVFRYQADRKFSTITRGAKLLYHGTVAHRFGLSEAIEAVSMLQNHIPGTELHIYGKYDPGYRAELENKIGALNLSKRIFLHGFRNHEEIYEIIQSADIGVVPYRSDDFMNLALSTKGFEYAASGLPVVASRLRSMEAFFDEDSVRYAEPESPEDLAEKIAQLCRQPELRKSQAERARIAYCKVSGNVMGRRYLDVIQKLLAQPLAATKKLQTTN